MDKDHAGDIETVSIDPVTGREDEFMQDDNFSFSGYQIAREEFFAHAREPALIITGNRLYANKVCLNKAPDAERGVFLSQLLTARHGLPETASDDFSQTELERTKKDGDG